MVKKKMRKIKKSIPSYSFYELYKHIDAPKRARSIQRSTIYSQKKSSNQLFPEVSVSIQPSNPFSHEFTKLKLDYQKNQIDQLNNTIDNLNLQNKELENELQILKEKYDQVNLQLPNEYYEYIKHQQQENKKGKVLMELNLIGNINSYSSNKNKEDSEAKESSRILNGKKMRQRSVNKSLYF